MTHYLPLPAVVLRILINQEMMSDVRAAGWTRFEPVDGQPIAEKDMKKVFKMVDLNKGGTISQVELKMGLKFIGRRYGLSDVRIT